MNIKRLITKHGLDRHREFILESLAPCVHVSTEKKPDVDIAIGKSKFGGFPDLPEDFDWPHCQPYPMTHLAQLNCEEIAEVLETDLLPPTGIIHFFVQTDETGYLEYPTDDETTWLVAHSQSNSLNRTEPPEDSEFFYDARELELFEGSSLPDRYDGTFKGFSGAEMESYRELLEDLGAHEHQLFGFPTIIQPADFEGVDLIMQIISEDDDLMFGDCGYLHFTRKKGADMLSIDLHFDQY